MPQKKDNLSSSAQMMQRIGGSLNEIKLIQNDSSEKNQTANQDILDKIKTIIHSSNWEKNGKVPDGIQKMRTVFLSGQADLEDVQFIAKKKNKEIKGLVRSSDLKELYGAIAKGDEKKLNAIFSRLTTNTEKISNTSDKMKKNDDHISISPRRT